MYQPLAHGAAYFGRKPGIAHTKQTAKKTGVAIHPKPAKFPRKVAPKKPSGRRKGGGKGGGKGVRAHTKQLVIKTKHLGAARRNAGNKFKVMPAKSGDPASGRQHHYRPSTHSLREIWYYQKKCWSTVLQDGLF